MAWYVIYTKSNSEKKVSKYLESKGIVVYCPVQRISRQWSDRMKCIDVPLFKSYVFVNLADYTSCSRQILGTQGIVRFVWWQGKPGIVKDDEINAIIKFLQENKGSEVIVDYNINVGDLVHIKQGALTGQSGKVITIKGKNAVLQLTSLQCRLLASTPVKNIELK